MGERQLIHIGFGNTVSSRRLISIVSPESAPIRRLIQDARENGRLIDATYGRRTRAVIIMDSDHVVLSAFHPVTVAHRWTGESLTSNREKSADLIKEDEEMDDFDLPKPEDEDMSIDEDMNIDEDMSIDEDISIDEDMNIDEDISIDEPKEDEGENSK